MGTGTIEREREETKKTVETYPDEIERNPTASNRAREEGWSGAQWRGGGIVWNRGGGYPTGEI